MAIVSLKVRLFFSAVADSSHQHRIISVDNEQMDGR